MNIIKEIDISAPPERVWQILCEPKFIASWLMEPQGFRPELACKFVFESLCEGRLSTIHCEVLELVLEDTLVFSWLDADIELDSVVTFKLTKSELGTKLYFEHKGWQEMSAILDQHANTWRLCLDEIAGLA